MIQRLGARLPSVRYVVGRESPADDEQSVAIARALTFNPKLVIMDEPTAALAVREVEHVLGSDPGAETALDRSHPHQPPSNGRFCGLR